MKTTMGYIWAFPVTILGYLFGLVMWACWQTLAPVRGEIGALHWHVYNGSWLWKILQPRAAFVFGAVIFILIFDGRIRRHEYQHVKDVYRLGVFFYLIYFGEYLYRLIFKKGDPYWDNWLEKRAIGAEKGE